LLDESTDHCSIRTMYRVLDEQGPVRGDRLRHSGYERPELMATGGCQFWRWGITEIKDTMKGQSFHLYVIIDVFSRYVVGWRVADRASDTLARRLLAETISFVSHGGTPSGTVLCQLRCFSRAGQVTTTDGIVQHGPQLASTASPRLLRWRP
jgi:hypothetical protein